MNSCFHENLRVVVFYLEHGVNFYCVRKLRPVSGTRFKLFNVFLPFLKINFVFRLHLIVKLHPRDGRTDGPTF